MAARIETDTSRWPLVVVTLPGERVTLDEVNRFVQDQRDMLTRGEPHALLCDGRNTLVFPPDQRKVMADWLQEAEPMNRAHTVCLAIVLSNPLVRGALTAVMWLREPACETRTFATISEAEQWCLSRLRVAGVPVPATVAQG